MMSERIKVLEHQLAKAQAENARLRDLLEPVQPRRKWRPIPRVSYTNFRKLYPQSRGFKRWLVAERFWRKRLWVIGIRHHIVKIDWRRDWVRDMFESELDLESLIPKSQHNDILDMVRRTEVEPLKAENARLAAETTRLLDALIAADYILGRVETITLKGDENPPKYHWGEAADLVHSTLYQHQLEYAASQPQKPEQSTLSAAVDKARGGPTPPKEYQGFA